MNKNVVTRNGKKGFIGPDGKFYEIPQPNTTDRRIPREDQSALDAMGSIIKNIFTGKGAAGIRRDATRANPNYVGPGGGRPPVTQSPDEYFGTGDHGAGGPKDKPKPQFADLRGGDNKVDGYGNPKVNTPQPQSLTVEPYKDPSSNTPTPTSTPSKDEKRYKFSDKSGSYNLTKAEINRKYDDLRYGKDGKIKPADQLGNAKDFGLNANAAVFPNQKIFVNPKTGKPVRKSSTSNPTTAATGGVNPRAGTYAAELQRTKDALSSNFGALPKGTIKPVENRTTKKEAYDMVLDYLLSEGHVETVEEAHYIMLQMTSEHVQDIVEGVGYSNPSVGGKPVMNPKGHPKAGEPMSFNKAETDGVNEYRKASKKAGKKIYADEPLPKK